MIATAQTTTIPSGLQYLPQNTDNLSAISPNQELLPLTARANAQDHLEISGCDVPELLQQFGSPLYIVDEKTLRTTCQQYRSAFSKYYAGESLVLYATKAWNCLAICAIAHSEGLGMDVVSGCELSTAIQAGVKPSQIYFHGNNKSRQELQLAIDHGCRIVVDNWLELENLADLTKGIAQPVNIMIRFTPGIECHTHEYIRTGHLDSKFGFDPNQLNDVFQFISQQPGLACIGLHAHIGSQIFELQPHQDLAGVMVETWQKAISYGLPVTEINIGGGLGIRYTEQDDPPSIDAWVKVVSEAIASACQAKNLPLPKLLSEPGRSIIGTSCVTGYTVGSQKTIPEMRTYISVDGGMSDNPRPITYQSVYRAVIANKMSAACTEKVTVAGKHCESGDILIKDATLPPTVAGDCLVVMDTGAYNYSMASNYNRLPRPAAILVNAGQANVIIQWETYEDLMRQDCLPDRLKV